MQSPVTSASTIEQLTAQLDGYKIAAEAWRERYESLYRVITTTHWERPRDRVVYGAILGMAYDHVQPDGVAVFDDLTWDSVAELTGLSKPTVGDSLQRLEAAGLVERQKDTETVNRQGQPIPRMSANPQRGDRWQTTVTTFVPITIPDNLPDLGDTTKARRERQKQKDFYAKAQDAFKTLAELECPECHTIGDWQLTCGACGAIMTAPDLAGDYDKDSLPQSQTAQLPVMAETQTAVKTLYRSDSPVKILTAEGNTEEERISTPPPISVSDHAAPITVETLTGADTIDYLADLGAQFCLVEPRGKVPITTRNEWGDELSWPDTPIAADAAKRHMARGGNVGLLTGRGQMVLIDVDDHLPELLQRYPMMGVLPRFTRQNAPDRGKLLCFVPESDTPSSHKYSGNGHTIELLGVGHQGVVAGTHASGATIEFTPGELVVFRYAQLVQLCTEWTASPNQPRGEFRTSAAMAAATVKGDMLRTTYQWFDTDGAYLAEVQRLLDQCPRKGQYVAIRADDRTPSCRASRDTYSQTVKPTWRDYGTGETLDAVELYCRLTGTDKRTYQWQLVNEYRLAQGLPALQLR